MSPSLWIEHTAPTQLDIYSIVLLIGKIYYGTVIRYEMNYEDRSNRFIFKFVKSWSSELMNHLDHAILAAVIRDDELMLLMLLDNNGITSAQKISIQDRQKVFSSTIRPYLRKTSIPTLCCFFRAIRCYKALEERGWNVRTLECVKAAAAGGSVEILKCLHESNSIRRYRKPLRIAAKYASLDSLRYLCATFGKPDLDTIICGIETCIPEVIDFLIETGGIPDAVYLNRTFEAMACKGFPDLSVMLMKKFSFPKNYWQPAYTYEWMFYFEETYSYLRKFISFSVAECGSAYFSGDIFLEFVLKSRNMRALLDLCEWHPDALETVYDLEGEDFQTFSVEIILHILRLRPHVAITLAERVLRKFYFGHVVSAIKFEIIKYIPYADEAALNEIRKLSEYPEIKAALDARDYFGDVQNSEDFLA